MTSFLFISGVALEWIVFLFFGAAIIGVTAAEIIWLVRNRWAEFARSLCFVFASNAVGFIVGGAVIFVIVLLLFMMTMEEKTRNALGGEGMMWVLVVCLFSVVPVLLFFSKRLFLSAFRMRAGRPVWVYSLVSTLMIIIVGFALPTVAAYLITKGGSAK
jgi:hypothetical protein